MCLLSSTPNPSILVWEAVDSPVFSAGGLERLQFHFYPKGCVGRPEVEGLGSLGWRVEV